MTYCIQKLKVNSQKLNIMLGTGNTLIDVQADFTNFIHYPEKIGYKDSKKDNSSSPSSPARLAPDLMNSDLGFQVR